MADKTQKTAKNVEGKYYVDSDCIDCNLCIETAQGFFLEDQEAAMVYVAKQPTNDAEVTQCEAAVEECPVDAIGNDG